MAFMHFFEAQQLQSARRGSAWSQIF